MMPMNLKRSIVSYVVIVAIWVFIGFYFCWRSEGIPWGLGLATVLFLFTLAYLNWERRLVRRLAEMSTEERERKLGAMEQVRRERIKKLLLGR
jgi:hypothetical protein